MRPVDEPRSAAARQDRREAEGVAHVAAPRGGRQTCLRSRRARSPERVHDRAIETPREVAGLIEAAPQAPPRVQRHRHDAVGVREHVGAGVRISAGERRGKRASSFVLERVDDVAQRAFVRAARSAPADAFRLKPEGTTPAPRAHRRGEADDAPGGERVATRATERWLEGMDRGPAGRAHGTGEWGIENPPHRRRSEARGRRSPPRQPRA